jgi:hypothetical protein
LIDIQTVSLVIACVSVVVGVASVVDKNRREVKTREANLYMQITNRLCDPEVSKNWNEVLLTEKWKTWEEYEARYGWGEHLEDESKVLTMINWFEILGTLVKEKLIDPKLLYKSYSTTILLSWVKLEPIILGFRKMTTLSWGKSFEYLVNLFKKMLEEEEKGEAITVITRLEEEREKLLEKGSAGGQEQ